MVTDLVVLKDFTPNGRRRKAFAHGGETYEIVPTLPLDVVPTFILMGEEFSKLSVSDMRGAIGELKHGFELALVDESYERFEKRLSDRDNPIGIEAITIFTWIISEVVSLPTEESSDSSTTSPAETSGSSSTDGAPVEVSTQ
jgi:hypothetical protein